jgi:hypothetical protein
MPKYNHAYTIAFEVVTEHPEGNATPDQLIQGLLRRLYRIMANHKDEMIDACEPPYDTYECGPNDDICAYCGRPEREFPPMRKLVKGGQLS